MSKNVNFRASDEVSELLENLYGSKGGGAERIVPAFFEIRKYTLRELLGIFTGEEIAALVDSLNGTLQDASFQANKGVLIAHLEDFETFEHGVSRHGADLSILREKINRLTASQVYFLQNEIDVFWRRGAVLSDFIKTFSNG